MLRPTANDGRTILRYPLRDHSAKRKSENIAGFYLQSRKEGQNVLSHAGNGCRHRSCGASPAGVVI
jgi:hypothetical protein